MTRVAAVVLAAGAATRFGAPKQQLLLPRVLERLAKSSVGEIVVVGGAYDFCVEATQDLRVRHVHCPEWERGPGASLRSGLEALGEDVGAAVVVLADGPLLAPAAVDRVVSSWRDEGGDVVAASYDGIRGHPLVVSRTVWPDVPDEGLRALEPRLVLCDDLGFPGDVDTPEDLARLDDPR